jgi:hypothetical protein
MIHLTLVNEDKWMHGWCETNTIMVSFIIFMPPSLNMYLAHANGHYMGIFVVVLIMCIDFIWTITLTTATHGRRLNIVGSRQCLQT